MLNSTPNANANPLPTFGNILLQRKSFDVANRQLETYSRLIEKLDGLYEAITADTKARRPDRDPSVKSAIKDKLDDVKQSFTLDNTLRKILKPAFGSITARVIDNIEEKRLKKTADKIEKDDFKNNFFDNTMLGKTVDKNSKKGDNLAEEEYKKFKALTAQKEKIDANIEAKKNFKSRFGVGGPNKKELDIQLEMDKLLKANTIRIEKGQKAAEAFMKDKGKEAKSKDKPQSAASAAEDKKESISLTNKMVDLLGMIEVNTRGDKSKVEEETKPEVKEPSWLDRVISFIKDAMLALALPILSLVKSIPSMISEAVKSLGNLVAPIVKNAKGVVSSAVKTTGEFLSRNATKVKDSLVMNGTKILDSSKKAVGDGAKSLLEKGGSAIKKGVDVVKGGLESPIVKGLVSSGSNAAKFLGKALPGVGLGISAYDATERYKAGDTTGAAIAGAAGAAAMVPGVGTLASLGLNGLNLARDFFTEKPENNTSNQVSKKSTEVDMAKLMATRQASVQQNSIVAPTYNSSNTNITKKVSVRNTETSFNRYLKNRD